MIWKIIPIECERKINEKNIFREFINTRFEVRFEFCMRLKNFHGLLVDLIQHAESFAWFDLAERIQWEIFNRKK